VRSRRIPDALAAGGDAEAHIRKQPTVRSMTRASIFPGEFRFNETTRAQTKMRGRRGI
jgi:hypothetical protein